MAITYKGNKLNGTIMRNGAHAGGNRHFVLSGQMLCPSGLNFYANDLSITSYSIVRDGKMIFTLKNAEKALQYISCKKCYKKLNDIIENTKKVGA